MKIGRTIMSILINDSFYCFFQQQLMNRHCWRNDDQYIGSLEVTIEKNLLQPILKEF